MPTLTTILQEAVDVQPGHLELPELRRVTPDGYGALVPLSEASDDDLAAYRVALIAYRAQALAAIDGALSAANREDLRRMNAADAARRAAIWRVTA